MFAKIKLWFIVIGISFTVSSAFALQTGDMAPDFTLTDTNGQSHSLGEFKGKTVVLEWFNPDCPFVKKHYDSQNMQNLQKKYIEQGAIWLSINSSAEGKQGFYSSQEYNRLTEEKDASPTALLLDRSGDVGRLYGAQTTPHMYIINTNGVLVYQGAIDSIPSVDVADIATAQNYVQAALDEIAQGKPVTTSTTKSYGCSVKY